MNVDPRFNRFRLWDIDAGRSEGFGTRFLDQGRGLVWVSSFGTSLQAVAPGMSTQWRWDLGFVPAGLAVTRDGTVMMPSGGTPSGQLHRLDARARRLTSWTLPQEQAPFSGIATPLGRFVFAKRRPVGGIARFDPKRNILLEWDLPPGSNPQVVSRDRSGRIWFSDANFNDRIGRLDPRRNTVALFIKPGIVTFSVRPVDRRRLGRVVAAADLLSYLDVLDETRVPETPVRVCRTVLEPSVTELPAPVPSPATLATLVIPPTRQRVTPVEPPALFRYPVPVVAPIDVVEHGGAIYATAGVFDERKGPSRLFRLRVGLAGEGGRQSSVRRRVARSRGSSQA